MATLIKYKTSSGEEGRCDARCYNATSERCECICQGRNHGVGLIQAMRQTDELVGQWVDEFARQHSDEEIEVIVYPHTIKVTLFDYLEAKYDPEKAIAF